MAAETSAPDSTIEPSFRSNLWLLNALTIFLSAFLLFQVEPLVAKIILPRFGGVAAVWTACLLFFQVWLATARKDSRVYRFYALSNAGSLLGLLSFPMLV